MTDVAATVRELREMAPPPHDRDRSWLGDLSAWPTKLGVAECIKRANAAGAPADAFEALGGVEVTLVDTRPLPVQMWGTCFANGAGDIPRDPRDYTATLKWAAPSAQACLTVAVGRGYAYAATNGSTGHLGLPLDAVLKALSPADVAKFHDAFAAAVTGLTGELIREQFQHDLDIADATWHETATATIRRLAVATRGRAFDACARPYLFRALPCWALSAAFADARRL